ncbi:MAG: dihydrolipoyllysine-residue succinyltransferase [Flavobacteriales bacterium]|nr:dihydrolipoyllysine-residue succinyltransferase [Flavobacteriales bacterium]
MIEIKVPSPGESITEVEIANWLVESGDYVEKDQEICEIDSDKATLTINAEESGEINILVNPGEMVPVGSIICTIDDSKKSNISNKTSNPVSKIEKEVPLNINKGTLINEPSPAAKKMMRESQIVNINGTGKDGRITKQDVIKSKAAMGVGPGKRKSQRKKLSSLRRKLASRLVSVKNETAMLTTFNEVDMTEVNKIRKNYKEKFQKKYGVKLGYMSFFTKAVVKALQEFPDVNSMIDGDEIVHYDYQDISIAVSTPKGLMAPVVRNAEDLDFFGVENEIARLATKARDGKISIDDMLGGTFTITNGGVFGSMLSTPIINPPQSAILGMHNIVERPMVVNGKIVSRPIMYIALSYDHRIIDGKESVGFLVSVKNSLENPKENLFAGNIESSLLKKAKNPLSYRSNYKHKL